MEKVGNEDNSTQLLVLLLAPFVSLTSRKKGLGGNIWKGNVIKTTVWPHYVLVHILTEAYM